MAPQGFPLRFARFGGWGWGGALRECARPFRPHPALACHLPHPGEGYCGCPVRFRDSVDFLAGGNFCQKVVFLEVAPTPNLPPGGEGGTPVPDEGETGERTHVTHPANTNRQFTSHAPVPHRVILSEAAQLTKNHAHPPTIAAQRTPPPGGAPAGGISLAKWHYIKHRTTPLSASPVGGVRYTLRSNNGDPACWRPAWGGVRCAALFCCRVRP